MNECLQLRIAGASYQEIAARLGISKSYAYKVLRRALERLAQESIESAARLRALELARLDRMQAAVWRKVVQGDMQAIGVALRISERRARLLGLDAPERAETEPVQLEVVFRRVGGHPDENDAGDISA